MKEIAVVSNYFPPENGAASNRIYDLCQELHSKGYKVSVICPLPNYPKGKIFKPFRRKLYSKASVNGITIHRLWIFPSNSKNLILRLISMASFSLSISLYFLKKQPRTVFIQSPPLLVSATSVFWLSRSDRKIILNVSDLWPHSALELGILKKGFLYSVLLKLERYIYSKASLVIGQSKEIVDHVNSMFPDKKTFLYRNYPRHKSDANQSNSSAREGNTKIIYAGLLGVAQGILRICNEVSSIDNVEFHIYGEGMERQKIIDYIESDGVRNITYWGEIRKDELADAYRDYDIALVPLIRPIYGAVPSKLFELAIHGIPVLYFGGGEGEEIVNEYKLGYVIEPSDYERLKKTLSELNRKELYKARKHIRSAGNQYFDFSRQFGAFFGLLDRG